MSDAEARRIYERAGIGTRLALGSRPAVLVIDLQLAFTDPAFALGADLAAEVEQTRRVLELARGRDFPVVFTVVAYEPHAVESVLWVQKSRALADLRIGSRWVEIDARLGRREDEPIVVKKGASGFFGTDLASILVGCDADTVVLCGASTSGCIRATAVDLLQYGWPTLVPRECVGDRARAPHEANLFDIDAKYADVVSVDEALAYLGSVPARVAAPTSELV
jgi:nicotinamidase-related amidase